jgi:hypothetical protein
MRILGMLIFLLVGLGLGTLPTPASASPCPHHAQAAPAAPYEGRAGKAPAAPAAEIVVVAAIDQIEATPVYPVADHAIPEGQPCCHAAPLAAQASGAVVVPDYSPAGRLSLGSSMPPWAAPIPDIYRPPAFA